MGVALPSAASSRTPPVAPPAPPTPAPTLATAAALAFSFPVWVMAREILLLRNSELAISIITSRTRHRQTNFRPTPLWMRQTAEPLQIYQAHSIRGLQQAGDPMRTGWG